MGKLQPMRYRGGYKYQLASDYLIATRVRPKRTIQTEYLTLTRDGLLAIRKGYAWDGPSGPTLDTRNFMVGSVAHDALYQIMRLGHLDAERWREVADSELRRLCRQSGMSRLRAWWVYRAVRIWGSGAATVGAIKRIEVAP